MKISLIGTGLMGKPMAEKLIEAGHELTVYNRTVEKTASLREQGAQTASSVNDAIAASDCILLMLSDYNTIVEAVFYSNTDLDVTHKTFINMSTIAPDESIDLHERIVNRGGAYLEAPVLGSIPQIRDDGLIVMVGSSDDLYKKWKEFLNVFGPDPIYIGDVGKAAAMKLALNQLIASLTASFSLSLGLILKHGIDVDQFMTIIRNSALYAPTYDKKLKRYLQHDYSSPNFPTKHLKKDVDLIVRETKNCGLQPDSLQGVQSIIEKALKMNYVDTDYSSIFEAISPDT